MFWKKSHKNNLMEICKLSGIERKEKKNGDKNNGLI